MWKRQTGMCFQWVSWIVQPFLSPLHLKEVFGHAENFVPPRWYGETDIDDVCVVNPVIVVGELVKDLSCGDLVAICDGVLGIDDTHLFQYG